MKINLSVSAFSSFDIHKLTISPSVAVNPPAIQYFKGVVRDWTNGNFKNDDNRFAQMKENIVTMLSSDEYPNPPICSKRTASKIADKLLPKMLRKIKNKDITVTAETII